MPEPDGLRGTRGDVAPDRVAGPGTIGDDVRGVPSGAARHAEPRDRTDRPAVRRLRAPAQGRRVRRLRPGLLLRLLRQSVLEPEEQCAYGRIRREPREPDARVVGNPRGGADAAASSSSGSGSAPRTTIPTASTTRRSRTSRPGSTLLGCSTTSRSPRGRSSAIGRAGSTFPLLTSARTCLACTRRRA